MCRVHLFGAKQLPLPLVREDGPGICRTLTEAKWWNFGQQKDAPF
jgi:hypothetical protein